MPRVPWPSSTTIRGLDEAARLGNVTIFHAGTGNDGEAIVATGGRVLGITGLGATVAEARTRAYEAVDLVDWAGGFCRRDIGWRAIRAVDDGERASPPPR